ncbi:hypothetical protein ACWEQ1_34365 [Streptomyces nodosus]
MRKNPGATTTSSATAALYAQALQSTVADPSRCTVLWSPATPPVPNYGSTSTTLGESGSYWVTALRTVVVVACIEV